MTVGRQDADYRFPAYAVCRQAAGTVPVPSEHLVLFVRLESLTYGLLC